MSYNNKAFQKSNEKKIVNGYSYTVYKQGKTKYIKIKQKDKTYSFVALDTLQKKAKDNHKFITPTKLSKSIKKNTSTKNINQTNKSKDTIGNGYTKIPNLYKLKKQRGGGVVGNRIDIVKDLYTLKNENKLNLDLTQFTNFRKISSFTECISKYIGFNRCKKGTPGTFDNFIEILSKNNEETKGKLKNMITQNETLFFNTLDELSSYKHYTFKLYGGIKVQGLEPCITILVKNTQQGITPEEPCNKRYRRENLEFKDKIGEGGFGNVYTINNDNNDYLIKIGKQEGDQKGEIKFINHIKSLKDKNIIKDDFFTGICAYYTCVELQNAIVIKNAGDSLKDLMRYADNPLKNDGVKVKTETQQDVETQLDKIINKIHDVNVFHMDIKPDNICYNSETKIITLIDFGLCNILPFNKEGKIDMNEFDITGTPGYVSPILFLSIREDNEFNVPNIKENQLYVSNILNALVNYRTPNEKKSDTTSLKNLDKWSLGITINEVFKINQNFTALKNEIKNINNIFEKEIKKILLYNFQYPNYLNTEGINNEVYAKYLNPTIKDIIFYRSNLIEACVFLSKLLVQKNFENQKQNIDINESAKELLQNYLLDLQNVKKRPKFQLSTLSEDIKQNYNHYIYYVTKILEGFYYKQDIALLNIPIENPKLFF